MPFQGGRVVRSQPISLSEPRPNSLTIPSKENQIDSSFINDDKSSIGESTIETDELKLIFNYAERRFHPLKKYTVKSIEKETMRDLWNFYVTVEEDSEMLGEIEEIITRHVVLEHPISLVSFGSLSQMNNRNQLKNHFYNGNICLLKHKNDWHRGVIHEANESGKSKVIFLDSGVRMKKTLENLFIAPNELRRFPPMAFHCKLMSIPKNDKGTWDDEIYEKLLHIANNRDESSSSFNGNNDDEKVEQSPGTNSNSNVQIENFFINPIGYLLSPSHSLLSPMKSPSASFFNFNEKKVKIQNRLHESKRRFKGDKIILTSIKFDTTEKTNVVEFTVLSNGEEMKLIDFLNQMPYENSKTNAELNCDEPEKRDEAKEIQVIIPPQFIRPPDLLNESLNRHFIINYVYPCGQVLQVMEKKSGTAAMISIMDEIVYFFKISNPEPIEEKNVGDLVLAPYFTTQNKAKYYQRAIVLKVLPDTCKVKFIDLGGILQVENSRLRKPNDKISNILPFGHEVKLFSLTEAVQHIYSGDLESIRKALVKSTCKLHQIYDLSRFPPEVDFTIKESKEEILLSNVIAKFKLWRWEKLYNAGFKTITSIKDHPDHSVVTQCPQLPSIPFNEEVQVTILRLLEGGKSVRVVDVQSMDFQKDLRVLHDQLQKFGNDVTGPPFVPKIDKSMLVKFNNEWKRATRISTRSLCLNQMYQTVVLLLDSGNVLPYRQDELDMEFQEMLPDFDRIPPFVVTCQIKDFVGVEKLETNEMKSVEKLFVEGAKMKVFFSKDPHSFNKEYQGPIYLKCPILTQRLEKLKKSAA